MDPISTNHVTRASVPQADPSAFQPLGTTAASLRHDSAQLQTTKSDLGYPTRETASEAQIASAGSAPAALGTKFKAALKRLSSGSRRLRGNEASLAQYEARLRGEPVPQAFKWTPDLVPKSRNEANAFRLHRQEAEYAERLRSGQVTLPASYSSPQLLPAAPTHAPIVRRPDEDDLSYRLRRLTIETRRSQ